MNEKEINNLASFKGDGKRDKRAEAFRDLQNGMEQIIQSQSILAKITRAKYNALLAEGFTEQQALELCKAAPV